jgi:hypothetical protein
MISTESSSRLNAQMASTSVSGTCSPRVYSAITSPKSGSIPTRSRKNSRTATPLNGHVGLEGPPLKIPGVLDLPSFGERHGVRQSTLPAHRHRWRRRRWVRHFERAPQPAGSAHEPLGRRETARGSEPVPSGDVARTVQRSTTFASLARSRAPSLATPGPVLLGRFRRGDSVTHQYSPGTPPFDHPRTPRPNPAWPRLSTGGLTRVDRAERSSPRSRPARRRHMCKNPIPMRWPDLHMT